MSEVLAPLLWKRSPNFSSRRGAAVTHLVWHATIGHYEPSIAWLCEPTIYDAKGNVVSGPDASAHLVMDEHGDESTQLVLMIEKAWHAEAWNAFTVGIEHASLGQGFATHTQLTQSALLFGWLCRHFNIPPVHGLHKPRGIVRHRDLGVAGGGHHDGPNDLVWFGEYLPLVHHFYSNHSYRKAYLR